MTLKLHEELSAMNYSFPDYVNCESGGPNKIIAEYTHTHSYLVTKVVDFSVSMNIQV